jgi:hypothetical protein
LNDSERRAILGGNASRLFRADTVLREMWFGTKVKMQPNILKDIMSAYAREV